MPGQNWYPDPDNYPAPSFPQPIPPPEVDPDEGETVLVAYSLAWQQVLLAAVDQLLLPGTWQGDHDQVITALNRASNLKYLLQEPYDSQVPAPYWDDAEDADDQEPESEQPWYGHTEGITFVEDIGIWAITGFIAYSGDIGAAIAFRTFAPRFVLAWKADGIGGAIRVFIDGVDNGLLDTQGDPDTIIEKDYIGDPDLDEHDILMILESVPV